MYVGVSVEALEDKVDLVPLWCYSYVDIRTMGVCCLKPFAKGRQLCEARIKHVGPSWGHLGVISEHLTRPGPRAGEFGAQCSSSL